MTTDEIRTLIDQKIAGQGSMVDIGGALPNILNALVDAIDGGGGSEPIYVPFEHGEDGEVYDITADGMNILRQAHSDGKLLDVVLREESGGLVYALRVIGYREVTGGFYIFFVENYSDTKRVSTIYVSEN